MNSENTPLTRFIEKDEENGSGNFGETISKYLYYWPLFLVCIISSLAVAYVYLHYAKPEYIVKAKLLIKAEKSNPSSESSLNEIIKPYQTGKSVEDEIEILKSRSVIQQVVKNLELWTNYEEKGKIVSEDLYGQSPVKFVLVRKGQDFESRNFLITIINDDIFSLKDEEGNVREFRFSDQLKNKFGSWKLQKTPNFENYVGKVISVRIKDPEIATDQLLGRIQAAEVNKNASVVELSIQENVLKRGKDILNQLIVQYNLASEKEKERVAGTALKFIDERLASLTGELNAVEKDVEGFRSSRGLTDISSESKVYLDNVRVNDAHLNEVDVQLNVIKGIERYVNSPDNANTSAPSTIGIDDPALTSWVSKLIDLQLQYQQLMGTLPEKNPAFEPIRQQIASTKNAIKQNINNIKGSLVSTRRQLESFNSGFKGSIRSLPSDERQLVSIKRQQSIKENLYLYLLQKREEAALSHASTLAFSQTVDSAYLDTYKKPLTYSLALFIGILLPASILFGRQLLNNKIVSTEQIERTGVPVTAELVYEYSKSPIVVHNKSRFAIGEQFRSLRTNLLYLHDKKKSGRVTLITSSIAGEGKSFVASNLGVALAASGRKTVILELDLRKPKIATNFNVGTGPGLSDFLDGHASIDQITRSSALHPNLSIIGTGTLPENPSELLEQIEIDELIEWLRSEYDDIILDTPPIFLVTDAMIISRVADASLYVVRQNFSYRKHLGFVKKIFKEHKLPRMQIVFNAIQKRGEYKYGYEYYTAMNTQKKHSLHSLVREVSNRLLLSNT
ncbi:MAG: GumC family protein [Arcticibacter sp.]